MPQRKMKVSNRDLQAFLDNELEPGRRRKIVEMIKGDPELMKRLAEYAAQNEGLHRLFDFVLNEPIPDDMLEIVKEYMPNKKE